MATYQYRCAQDGLYEIRLPIGDAGDTHPCPACGNEAVRKFSPPMLARNSAALTTALDGAERSREVPEVVTSVPSAPGRRTPQPLNPALSKLPRP